MLYSNNTCVIFHMENREVVYVKKKLYKAHFILPGLWFLFVLCLYSKHFLSYDTHVIILMMWYLDWQLCIKNIWKCERGLFLFDAEKITHLMNSKCALKRNTLIATSSNKNTRTQKKWDKSENSLIQMAFHSLVELIIIKNNKVYSLKS